MVTTDYQIKREDIMIGILSKIQQDLLEYYPKGLLMFSPTVFKEKIKRKFDSQPWIYENNVRLAYSLSFLESESHRIIVFALDEQQYANDLLYQSPKYPVMNLTNDEECLKAEIVITNYAFCIDKLLEYFHFPKILTYKEVEKIPMIFQSNYILDHSQDFGVYETSPQTSGRELFDQFGNHRTFNDYRDDGKLPSCYFDIFFALTDFKKKRFIPFQKENVLKLKPKK